MKDCVVVIMAGGAGTRFWPLSTEERPKQFLALTGERTLLQMSYDRVVDLVGADRILVLTSARYTGLVAEQLPDLPGLNIVGEPCRRDTAAAVALAGILVEHRFGDVPMAVLTADHVIGPLEQFHLALTEAVKNCGNGTLYTLGIKPTYPATQFGYLEMDAEVSGGHLPHFTLKRFKEKPDAATAREFVESGSYYWNSGMFVWQTADIVAEFQAHLPEHLEILRPVISNVHSEEFAQAFARLKPISVDFAILEKAKSIQAVIPKIEWDDVGGWLAVDKYLEQDRHHNCHHGPVHLSESEKNTVFLEDVNEEIVLLGVSDLVVVRSEGRTLVASKEHLDLIKAAVKGLDK
jgi:mannose-1-phosphate guanylyltransferase